MDAPQISILLSVLGSVVVIVWRFSALATKMEKLTEEVKILVADLKVQATDHHTLMTKVIELDVRVAVLERSANDR